MTKASTLIYYYVIIWTHLSMETVSPVPVGPTYDVRDVTEFCLEGRAKDNERQSNEEEE